MNVTLRSEAALTLSGEALGAEDGTIAAGLEVDLIRLSAVVADDVVLLTLGAVAAIGCATGSAAGRATARLVLETVVSVELLLRSGEDEFVAAFTAGQGFVFEHGYIPS